MREIKFRAWIPTEYSDEENPKMEMCYSLAFEDYESINNLLESVEYLMQYTGLKDKNGKEIYESDIVKDGDFIMWVGYNAHYASFCLYKDGWMSSHFFNEASKPENCIVIGNIYENPELLEGIK